MNVLWIADERLLFFIALGAFLLVLEIAFRLGRRAGASGDESQRSHNGVLQAASLGLLGLLLGFTFAMAVARYDARKALVLEEANAIGTTALRTQYLPQKQREASAQLLREYVAARLAFYRSGIDPAHLEAANATAARIEGALWRLAGDAVAADPHAVAPTLYVSALNEVIDNREKSQTALDNHVPDAVILLLFAVSVTSLGFLAFGGGLTGRRRFAQNAIFALLIALVLTIILDIDRPRRGVIHVNIDSLLRLEASVGQP